MPSPRPFSTLLATGHLKNLANAGKRQSALTEKILELMPSVARRHCRHAVKSGTQILLLAENPGGATLLRFQLPALLGRIRAELDSGIVEIKVRVESQGGSDHPWKRDFPATRKETDCVIRHLKLTASSCEHPEIAEAFIRLGRTLSRMSRESGPCSG